MWVLGAFAFSMFLLLSNLPSLGPLRVENQILVYICFVGVGLPLSVIGAGSLVNSWSDRLVRLVGFPASSLSGAILCALAIVSLPIYPAEYVTEIFARGSTTYPIYLRPRLSLGFNDVSLLLELSLLLLLVGAVLYGHIAKIQIGWRSFLSFIGAYSLVTVGVFLVLYPWTMGASLDVPTLPSYCLRIVGADGKILPSGCYVDLPGLGFAHPWLWPLTLAGLLGVGSGFVFASRSTIALRPEQSESKPTIASSS